MASIDYKALARAQYDPLTQNNLYRREKARLRRAIADNYAAQFAAPGSVAARNDPNDFGSLASRRNPGLFGRVAHARGAPQYDEAAEQEEAMTAPVGLRRSSSKTPFSLDDLDDDELLKQLGLDLGSLRRGLG